MLLNYLITIMSNYSFLLVITTLSFFFKLFILGAIVKKILDTKTQCILWTLLGLTLFANMTADIAWIVKITSFILIPTMDFRIVLFCTRIAWAFAIIQYQALALFLESLATKQYQLPLHQKILCTISFCFVLFQLGITFFCFNNNAPAMRPHIEFIFFHCVMWYHFLPVILSIFVVMQKLRSKNIPIILQEQLQVLVQILIIPCLVSNFIHVNPFRIKAFSFEIITGSLSAVGITTILQAIALFYCARRIMGLRFLNIHSHVQSRKRQRFLKNFTIILEQFSRVTNTRELEHITKIFFKELFCIPLTKIRLSFRNAETQSQKNAELHAYDNTEKRVEAFITNNEFNINESIKNQKIFMYDEVDFSYFYDKSGENKNLLTFLQIINSDIFLPIYEQDKIIAYITIERHARMKKLYNDDEQDEMIVFANYLGKIINLLKKRTLETFIEQEQSLKKELYFKHQEISQYKESIRSFLRTNKQRKLGIILCKDRLFTFANKDAKELVPININRQEGHPLTRTFKRVSQQVAHYKIPQQAFTRDMQDNALVLSAVPHSNKDGEVIIAVFYPEISDVIKEHIDLLKDPTDWDYLLYLQTTKSGQLINHLIPDGSETILNLKIALLKTALTNKSVLLTAPAEDLLPTVELLHQISLRETLHTMNLERGGDPTTIAIALFGINPIFKNKEKDKPALLEILDKTGTLFIKEINKLDLKCQNKLAEFIRYGFYHNVKGEQRFSSDVRIICSSSQNLSALVKKGKFSKELFHELMHTTLTMPSLLHLSKEEVNTLADSFSQQSTTATTFKNLLGLTERDKHKLNEKRPESFYGLKKRIQKIITEKLKKHEMYEDNYFDPSYETTDPELIKAARLGKQALKDQHIMAMLWRKFNKNQNKIATFLGVNRSSIHRRIKEYNLK